MRVALVQVAVKDGHPESFLVRATEPETGADGTGVDPNTGEAHAVA